MKDRIRLCPKYSKFAVKRKPTSHKLVEDALLIGTAFASSGDENYNGEEGEQPAEGVSPVPGEPNEAPDTGERTRFKDN
ncbi:hypothetical protein GF327_05725 [Candidatus Woesearchaeota archaeon]|nr:hypothetical protein [Candidatus Woesearchaeota archaeon]